jgi:hypothetical protein
VTATHIEVDETESDCSETHDDDVTLSALEIQADAFTRFIERQRADVMFELRGLNQRQRPVTGQSNRERIASFLHERHERQQPRQHVPSTRPVRPSAHMADINALSSRRCVSAALTSAAFRRDLENAIRQTISTQVDTPPVSSSVSSRVAAPATALPTEQEHRQVTPVSNDSLPTNITRFDIEHIVRHERHILDRFDRHERELNAWQAITRLQQELIVVEISDLVHRQLVTSALESDFRRHLERNVLVRYWTMSIN